MDKRYVKVNKVIEYDGEGGMFLSDSVNHNQEIYFTLDDHGQLDEISIFLTNRVFNLLINKEEMKHIEEQINVKKWEAIPFTFKQVEKIIWDNYPVIKRVHFSICESNLLLTAHYKDWKLHTITAPFHNTFTNQQEHTFLALSEVTFLKVDEKIKEEMVKSQSKII
ncbi:hypothetical protein [Bacillus pinisoli]|uniref:hypothetical protein n=1 Tax=Bacillus pinisoli TaxID=2901866 RepID=UPI001FF44659|nr:hypothetical protein [Bacillus pinisoli]